MAGILFNLTLEKVRENLDKSEWYHIPRSLQTMVYFDDIAIIERTRNEAIEAFSRIQYTVENMRLVVNTQQTKNMPAT